MKRKICVVLNNFNRYSFSSLLGALEGWEDSEEILSCIELVNEAELLNKKFSFPALFLFSLIHFYFIKKKIFLEKLFRELSSTGSKILVGGVGVIGHQKELLEMGANWICEGEGEVILHKFLQSWLLDEVEGYPEIIKGERVGDLSRYFPVSRCFSLFRPLEITRGCFSRCYYCQTPFFFSGKVRHRSKGSILEGLAFLYSRGYRRFNFTTPDAFSYGMEKEGEYRFDKVEDLLHTIKKEFPESKINWGIFPAELNPHSICEDSLAILKRYAENRTVVIGAQSGSERVLEKLNRNTYPELIREKVSLLRKHGFKVYIDYIFGFPFETEEDRKKTLTEIKRLEKMGAIIHTHYFIPLPQTPLARMKPVLYPEYISYLEESEKAGKSFGNWREQIDNC